MSKIEIALKKARANRQGNMVPIGGQVTSTGMIPANQTGMADVEMRSGSVQEIAKMADEGLIPKSDLAAGKIIYSEMENSALANTFREIRTKVLQRQRSKNSVIMITSMGSGGGSSFAAVNLAASFSFDESKTSLLLDCNFKNPGLNPIFRTNSLAGLTDYLENTNLPVADIIQPSGIKRLRLISAGGKREVPAEYFTSARMREFLGSIAQRYPDRYVIIDAPPILESADTHILMELCDFVLLVVPYGKYTNDQIKAAADAIGEQKLAGILINNEPKLPNIVWRDLFRFPKRKVGSGAAKVSRQVKVASANR